MSQTATIAVITAIVGSSAALLAFAFSFVFHVAGETNLAFGDAALLAAFVAATVWSGSGSAAAALAAGCACGAAAGVAVDRLVMSRLRGRGQPLLEIVASLGAALALRNVAQLAFGVEDRPFPSLFGTAHLPIADTSVDATLAVTFGVLLVSALTTSLALGKTTWGRAVVATRDDALAARLAGIPTHGIVTVLYALSGLFGACAAVLFFAHVGGISLNQGFRFTLTAYTAAALGGRSIAGPILGGFAVGAVVATTQVLAGAVWTLPVLVSLLVVVLLGRPRGLRPPTLVNRV